MSEPGVDFVTGWSLPPEELPHRFPNRRYTTRYEVRRLAGTFLFQLIDPGALPARASANCFQLKAAGLVRCSTADWNRADVLAAPPQVLFPFPDGPGKRFFDYHGPSEWSSPGVGLSMSYFGPALESTTAVDFVTPMEHLTPWTIQRLVVFEFYRRRAPATAFATLKFSMCGRDSWMRHGATFQGDDLFTMPLSKDGGTFLFCRLHD